VAAYAVSIGAILVLLHFFAQPYGPMLLSRQQAVRLLQNESGEAAMLMIRFLYMAVLLTGPVLCCFLPLLRHRHPAWLLLVAAASLTLTLAQIVSVTRLSVPYGNCMLTPTGPIMMPQDIFEAPALLPILVRFVLSCLVNFSILAALMATLRDGAGVIPRRDRTLYVFAIFSMSYLVFLLPGALTGLAFDRHMLPVIPLLMLETLRRFSCHRRRVPAPAWLCLALFAGYAVGTTHDYFATSRARVAAARQIEKAGVDRDHISAGFEYDAWNELERSGHVKVAQYQDHFLDESGKGFWYEIWDHEPGLRPDFVVLNEKPGEPVRGPVLKIHFHTWLAPRQRTVVIWRRSDLTSLLQAARMIPASPNWL